jgi:hypothetical protein
MATPRSLRLVASAVVVAAVCLMIGGSTLLLGVCGPFNDFSDATFCPFVLEILYLGITTGTTPTTFDPASSANRLQMAAFLSRTVDSVLKRGGRRASLNQFSTPQNATVLGLVTVPPFPRLLRSDGADVWVASEGSGAGRVSRVRASDGAILQTWTSLGDAYGVLVAAGAVIVTAETNPGRLYRIDPTQAPAAPTLVASNLGGDPTSVAFDGGRVWTGNVTPGSVSIITPGSSIPWSATTVTAGLTRPWGVIFDGANMWVTDHTAGTLLKLDAAGAVLQTVTVGVFPDIPTFDGSNIEVPNLTSVTVVRVSSGAVLGTLTGIGLGPGLPAAAFDGQRILVQPGLRQRLPLEGGRLVAARLVPDGRRITALSAHAATGSSWISLNGASKIALLTRALRQLVPGSSSGPAASRRLPPPGQRSGRRSPPRTGPRACCRCRLRS